MCLLIDITHTCPLQNTELGVISTTAQCFCIINPFPSEIKHHCCVQKRWHHLNDCNFHSSSWKAAKAEPRYGKATQKMQRNDSLNFQSNIPSEVFQRFIRSPFFFCYNHQPLHFKNFYSSEREMPTAALGFMGR